MVIFLHRPSPQIPEPSLRSAHQLFDAAVSNIGVQQKQIVAEPVVTWIWTQSLFLALNTTLFCLSYPEVRSKHSRQEVQAHVCAARSAIILASQRWPGVESALELYDDLIAACLRAYDENKGSMQSAKSPSVEHSPVPSLRDVSTPRSLLDPLDSSLASTARQEGLAPRSSPGTQYIDPEKSQRHKRSPDSDLESSSANSAPSIESLEYGSFPRRQNGQFDLASLHASFPPFLSSAMQPDMILYPDFVSSTGPIGYQYSQYMHTPYLPQKPLVALSEQQQIELMQDLETVGLRKG